MREQTKNIIMDTNSTNNQVDTEVIIVDTPPVAVDTNVSTADEYVLGTTETSVEPITTNPVDDFVLGTPPIQTTTTETNTTTEIVTTPAPTTPAPTQEINFNQPVHKFLSNANPFFIGVGIVVGLILLGDFFKSSSE